jgi:hypothetical protein
MITVTPSTIAQSNVAIYSTASSTIVTQFTVIDSGSGTAYCSASDIVYSATATADST